MFDGENDPQALISIVFGSVRASADKMTLDTASTYGQTLLRTDGRRWNELRRISASISTRSSSDGSSRLIMGNTVVVCTIIGPREGYVDDARAKAEIRLISVA